MDEVQSTEEFIKQQILSGRYKSRKEVIADAIRQMQERESELDYIADQLRKPYQDWKDGKPGKTVSLELIKGRVAKRQEAQNNSA